MIEATDPRGVTVRLAEHALRVVSLVPSTTETVAALAGTERLVGVTRFCVHPQPWVRTATKVGGTKDVDAERVRTLQPDLILGNCEENTRAIFDALEGVAPLWAAFPRTVDEAFEDVRVTATLLGVEPAEAAWRARALAAR